LTPPQISPGAIRADDRDHAGAAGFELHRRPIWRVVFIASAAMMVALAAVLARALPVRAPNARMTYGALIASMAHLAAATPILRRRAFYQACLFFRLQPVLDDDAAVARRAPLSIDAERDRAVRARRRLRRDRCADRRQTRRPGLEQASGACAYARGGWTLACLVGLGPPLVALARFLFSAAAGRERAGLIPKLRSGREVYAAFLLMLDVASLVRSWSALISCCNVSSRSFTAPLSPSTCAHVLSVP
jgi:hypothetical protein